MENGDMSDGQLNASSEGEGVFDGELFLYSAKNGRLNRRHWKMCWSPSTSDENQWFQVRLGQSSTFVTSIATQGCPFSTEWTASYKLQYGDDGVTFQYSSSHLIRNNFACHFLSLAISKNCFS